MAVPDSNQRKPHETDARGLEPRRGRRGPPRRDIAAAIRRLRPDVVITMNFDLTWGEGAVNQPITELSARPRWTRVAMRQPPAQLSGFGGIAAGCDLAVLLQRSSVG